MTRITFLRLVRHLLGRALSLGWVKKHALDRLHIPLCKLADAFDSHGPFCDLLCAYLSGAAEPGPKVVLSWAPDGRIRAENEIFTGSDLNFGYEYDFIGIATESRHLSQGHRDV